MIRMKLISFRRGSLMELTVDMRVQKERQSTVTNIPFAVDDNIELWNKLKTEESHWTPQ